MLQCHPSKNEALSSTPRKTKRKIKYLTETSQSQEDKYQYMSSVGQSNPQRDNRMVLGAVAGGFVTVRQIQSPLFKMESSWKNNGAQDVVNVPEPYL